MKITKNHSIIDLAHFIQATRDSGYKSTTSAIAEIIDNSLQAGATIVDVTIEGSVDGDGFPLQLSVADNGCGMSKRELRLALQFGGSSRFDSRDGMGRFGMGLPNASLSQSKRVEVVTWTNTRSAWTSYLDVTGIASGKITQVPEPSRAKLPAFAKAIGSDTGTVVYWKQCDRLDNRRVSTLERKLMSSIGRIFRHFLWQNVQIRVNQHAVIGVDPLYMHHKSPLNGAEVYENMTFDIRVSENGRETSPVHVTFTELPIEEWSSLSTDEKRKRGISNGAGLSIVRSEREIDYGWFLLPGKRKAPYDDWWRCEIKFEPELDEAFGITHTKQQIRPSRWLLEAISPTLLSIATALNGRVRERFTKLKLSERAEPVEVKLTQQQEKLPPLPKRRVHISDADLLSRLEHRHRSLKQESVAADDQPQFKLLEDELPTPALFQTVIDADRVVVVINTRHHFYKKWIRPLIKSDSIDGSDVQNLIHALLLAAGRGEAMASKKSDREVIANYLKHWGRTLEVLVDA